MINHILQAYESLTPKGRAILAILLTDYELNGEDGLTRHAVADQLGQRRLYPHDDRAIRQLEALGFIFISRERLGDTWGQAYGDDSLMRTGTITDYTIHHIHWLNAAVYDPLVDPLTADGLYQGYAGGYVGDFLSSLGALWKRLVG